MAKKRGIIQSRGLGDIIIALPIARHYYLHGEEIIWPICEEFLDSFKDTVPWVTWVPMKTDPNGAYFLAQPLKIFKYHGIEDQDVLYLYQYLNTVPELTSAELFNILKFDQYKYWVANVPFLLKWTLRDCITRDPAREQALKDRLDLAPRYCITHFKGSNFAVDIPVTFLDPAVQIVELTEFMTTNIFDWLGVLEGAEVFIGIDSCFANMVDQLELDISRKMWIRRSPWDLTPVLGTRWEIVPTTLPIQEPVRVDPAAEARKKLGHAPPLPQAGSAVQSPPAAAASGGLTSHVPFATDRSKYPKSFLHAVKKPSPKS